MTTLNSYENIRKSHDVLALVA